METRTGYFEKERTLQNSQSVTNEITGIAEANRTRVMQLALDIYPAVMDWVEQYPVLFSSKGIANRVAATCLSSASMYPDAAWEALLEDTNLSLMFFALDDVVDGAVGSYSDDELMKWLEKYQTIVIQAGETRPESYQTSKETGAADPAEQVARLLATCCQAIRKFEASKTYYEFFVKRFGLLTVSMKQELVWRTAFQANGSYPTYEAYLLNGRESVVAPTIAGAMLAMLSQPLKQPEAYQPPTGLSSLEELLDEVVLKCGESIRLGNDIRTFEREKLEGKVNSFVILTASKGLSEKEVEAILLQETDRHLARLDELVAQLPAELAFWGAGVSRMGWFTRDWYMTREFHNFSLKMLQALAQASSKVP